MNTKVFFRFFPLCVRFQLGNLFVNTKVFSVFFYRFFPLCIRFQLGSSFANTKVFFPFLFLPFFPFMYSFSIRQFICEY